MGTAEQTALHAWLESQRGDAEAVCSATAVELDRLLMTTISADCCPTSDLDGFLRSAGRRVDELPRDVKALATFLTPDSAVGGASLAEALAEILFVPRRERTEYRSNRLPSPPWRIRRLLLEYALWSQRLDDAATSLTRGFCASHCDRRPVGCCSIPGYDMDLSTEAMLAVQELEATMLGWTEPASEQGCKYHGPTGCCLLRFKSPACAGMLCDAVVADLRRRFAPSALEEFLVPLAAFRNQTLNRAPIFDAMREVVEAAQRLGSAL
jgi:hypothetical protein